MSSKESDQGVPAGAIVPNLMVSSLADTFKQIKSERSVMSFMLNP
jgi:hypothetical protein